MSKVKKGPTVTSVRNVKAGKTKPSARAAGSRAERRGTRKTSAKSVNRTVRSRAVTRGTKQAKHRGTKGLAVVREKKARLTPPAPVIRVAVRELDPQRKCGEGTSVQFLYRVDETVDGRATTHLVFLDRHGWYCEHGRTCPAVAHAKKQNGRFARVS